MMRFLRDSIREQIEARKANSHGAGWDICDPGQAAKNPQNFLNGLEKVKSNGE
jgi:hypothetical protein